MKVIGVAAIPEGAALKVGGSRGVVMGHDRQWFLSACLFFAFSVVPRYYIPPPLSRMLKPHYPSQRRIVIFFMKFFPGRPIKFPW
jgi:Kef-type K+ transport system membrane component KefB